MLYLAYLVGVNGSICSQKVLHPGWATLPSGGKGLKLYHIHTYIYIYRPIYIGHIQNNQVY